MSTLRGAAPGHGPSCQCALCALPHAVSEYGSACGCSACEARGPAPRAAFSVIDYLQSAFAALLMWAL